MSIHNFEYNFVEYREDGGYSTMIMKLIEPEIRKICKQDDYQVVGLTPDDLAQELRLELWKRIPRYQAETASIKTWAYRVLNDKIRNLKRDSARHKRMVQYFVSPLVEDEQ
jgi:RNA polymerase sigma factor (sigma-70 family)